MEALGFHLVGFGCTTCIGNSGPLPEPVAEAVQSNKLVVAAVLSGNRNFEGRINSLVSRELSRIASAGGRIRDRRPGGYRSGQGTIRNGRHRQEDFPEGYLADSGRSAMRSCKAHVRGEMFQRQYSEVFEGDQNWSSLKSGGGWIFAWDDTSTYIKKPPYFDAMADPSAPIKDLTSMRLLAMLGDSVTTDHISPAGSSRRLPGGAISDRSGREAGGLQFVWRAARQPRSYGARHSCKHPPAESARSRNRGRMDHAHSERRKDVHL